MTQNNYQNIALISALDNQLANEKKQQLIAKYGFIDLDQEKNHQDIDLIIILGGDGLMLHLLHKYEKYNAAFYGINCGTVGFLMNNPDESKLIETINEAQVSNINPLRMTATDTSEQKHSLIAINEVSLLRQLSQAANIKVKVNGKERISCLAGDGVLVATPAGSTAYNMSLRGPILPLDSNILALTPISPFRPRGWHGAILPENATIEFEILNQKTRPVSATADFIEVRNVKNIKVTLEKNKSFQVLFDANHSLEERIIREQFLG